MCYLLMLRIIIFHVVKPGAEPTLMRGTRAAAKIVTNDQQATFDKKGLPSSLQLHVLRHNRKHSHSSSLDLGVGPLSARRLRSKGRKK